MRKFRFTESQIVAILKEGEARRGVPVPEIVRKHGISRQTYFLWKSKYGGASVKDLARLKELEHENTKLKRMYAELALENAAIKDVLSRTLARPHRGKIRCAALRWSPGDVRSVRRAAHHLCCRRG
jgi:putative transposase